MILSFDRSGAHACDALGEDMTRIQTVDHCRGGSLRLLHGLLVCVCDHDKGMLEELFDADSLLCIEYEAVFEEVFADVCDPVWELGRLLRMLDHLEDTCSILSVLDPRWLATDHLNDAATERPDI